MTRNKRWLQLMLCCILCLMLAGCISSKYVERKQYLFDIQKNPAKKTTKAYGCSVFVEYVAAVAPFEQMDFLYRIKSGQYLVDYYHGFFVPPAEQLGSILEEHLKAYGHFNLDVVGRPAFLSRLQVRLTELYADYRNHNKPQAVIAVHFLLTKMVGDKTVVSFDKVLRESVGLKEKNTDSLLRSWNIGLQNILMQSTRALNSKAGC